MYNNKNPKWVILKKSNKKKCGFNIIYHYNKFRYNKSLTQF